MNGRLDKTKTENIVELRKAPNKKLFPQVLPDFSSEKHGS